MKTVNRLFLAIILGPDHRVTDTLPPRLGFRSVLPISVELLR
jgi:hypothetical protein